MLTDQNAEKYFKYFGKIITHIRLSNLGQIDLRTYYKETIYVWIFTQ